MGSTAQNIILSLSRYSDWIYRSSWLLISMVIFLFAFYQIPGESRDWQGYDDFFELLRIEDWDALGISRFEPGFAIVSLLLTKIISLNLAVYGMLAAGAIFLKCWIIDNLSSRRIFFSFVMLFYLVRFAPIHELTQLRLACASSFLLLAFVLLLRGMLLGCIAACAAALAFHLSSIVIIPFLFIRSRSRRNTVIISVLVFIAVLFGLASVTEFFQDGITVLRMYQEAGFGDDVPNPLSSGLLLDWAMIIIGLAMWDRLSSPMRHILLLQLIGMAVFYASMDFAVISHRIREFIAVFWVIFVAQGLQRKSPVKEVVVLFVIVNLLLYSYLFIYHEQFFL